MPSTLPRPSDSEHNLLAKYLRKRGGVPAPGDLEHDLWRKLLRLAAPSEQPCGTSVPKLAQRFFVALGGTPQPGDTYSLTLRRIVAQQGIVSAPSDNAWASLAKLLLAEAPGEEDTPPEGFEFLLDGDGTPILDGNGVPFVVLSEPAPPAGVLIQGYLYPPSVRVQLFLTDLTTEVLDHVYTYQGYSEDFGQHYWTHGTNGSLAYNVSGDTWAMVLDIPPLPFLSCTGGTGPWSGMTWVDVLGDFALNGWANPPTFTEL